MNQLLNHFHILDSFYIQVLFQGWIFRRDLYSLLRTADHGDAKHRSHARAVQGQLGPLEATGRGKEAGAEGAEGKRET